MEQILDIENKINKTDNIYEKIKLIKELNELIEVEKTDLTNILESDIDDMKIRIPIKYKKMSIDELEEAFSNCNNINEKIKIYHAINKYYTNIMDELFE
jgi:hypothetical protein